MMIDRSHDGVGGYGMLVLVRSSLSTGAIHPEKDDRWEDVLPVLWPTMMGLSVFLPPTG